MTIESVSARNELRVLLDVIDEPCWVIDGVGRTRIVNELARDQYPEMPSFVVALARGEDDADRPGFRVRRVGVDSETWSIVFAPRTDGAIIDTASLFGLDAHDAEIVDHLVRGFSDRELVLLTGRPIGTIHAAVVRIYRSLGVSNRTELVATVKRARAGYVASSRTPTLKSQTVPKNGILRGRSGTSGDDR